VPDDAGFARAAAGAAVVAGERRVLSPDRRRTSLPCWMAAVALHAIAAAAVVLYNPVREERAPAPIPVEFVMIAAAEPEAPLPAPVEAQAIEPAPAELPAAPPPEPPAPATIVDPPRSKPSRETARRSPPPAPQPQPSPPAAAAPSTDGPSGAVREPAQAVARPVPPAAPVPSRQSDYVSQLLARLERFREYPRSARLRRIEGQVVLELLIMADGQIASARVVAGSGHAALDDAALDMVRRAAPVPAPHDGPLALRVPVMFAVGAR
jgi:periplasmic protein TonB